MKQVKAVGDIVVVEIRIAKETVSEGGLILTARADTEAQSQALVVSVGSKVRGIDVGDTVIVSRMNGEMFELEGKFYRAMKQEDIFAYITESEPKTV